MSYMPLTQTQTQTQTKRSQWRPEESSHCWSVKGSIPRLSLNSVKQWFTSINSADWTLSSWFLTKSEREEVLKASSSVLKGHRRGCERSYSQESTHKQGAWALTLDFHRLPWVCCWSSSVDENEAQRFESSSYGQMKLVFAPWSAESHIPHLSLTTLCDSLGG